MGDNLTYKIGFLEYASSTNVGTLSKQLIIGLSVGAVVLILILVVCLIVYRQKSNQNSRVLKSMQEQMDVLELRVAAECKEGEDVLKVKLVHRLRCTFFPLIILFVICYPDYIQNNFIKIITSLISSLELK